MWLWLQCRDVGDLRSAVKVGSKNADVYKTNVISIFSLTAGASTAGTHEASLITRENPLSKLSLGNICFVVLVPLSIVSSNVNRIV